MADVLMFNPSTYVDMSIRARSIISPWDANLSNTFGDGTKIDTDSLGRIIQAEYASGAKVRRHEDYCLVQSTQLDFWYGDKNGRWFPLD